MMPRRCESAFPFFLVTILGLSPVAALSSLYGKTTRNIATQVLQGTGPPTVDLNQYNLPLNVIEKDWTANFVQKSIENEASVQLRAKNFVEHYVDTLIVSFPRKENGGLGIQLVELAGGRDDGIGITTVSGLVEGGSAEESGINPGDCLASVSLVRRKQQKAGDSAISEKEEEYSVTTECLSYDKTVEAVQSLPAPKPGFDDTFVLKVKRLRRRPKVKVNLQYPPEQGEEDTTIEMYAGENLRQGMLVRGVKLNDPLAKRFDTKQGGNCGAGGLCRTCSVAVVTGGDVLNPQRLAEKQMLQDDPRWRLACKAIVGYGMKEGEMTVRVNPRQW
ncbi:2Fe-2S iron-sulfur cluster binding domain containing protein [Nitzschia inconspicua]|uniref:2Fe-2S iron-sulfur cluster binding domain containing protein n=1 Tax=Nitzschia inconspicua TaxID=303405 RepID=A0A9K3LUA6_9STRA|nr:2Fe-2S iron-sulfur cluster binding domain containing protein [Nitzschia inconspicua]